ncbi:phosphotransferase family protein [Streptomyces sp. NPDC051985]|uniref:phosphotransferase family protein n=1 Tax=Streptomyces sp. NPDC051985 TaxID=3155807 RepID=UPI003444DF44
MTSPNSQETSRQQPLATALSARLSELYGGPCAVSGLHRLTGGASAETWALTATAQGRPAAELILRRDAPGAEDPARMALEADSLTEAARVGVPVPEVRDRNPGVRSVHDCALGPAYLLMTKVQGEALPRKLLRDEEFADIRPRLPYELGRVLARIHHRMEPDRIPGLTVADPLDQLRGMYHSAGGAVPVLELALRWLDARRPPAGRDSVVHGDFRNGNVIVGKGGIRAVLDWELVHRGDPMEDLGWLCVRAWRFGAQAPVGGFGPRSELFRGYEEESGTSPDPEAVRWWEVYGTLRWAVFCKIQAQRAQHREATDALELLAVGRRVAECEHDLLDLMGLTPTPVPEPPSASRADVFGSPSAAELLVPVRALLTELSAQAAPRTRHLGRIAANILDMVSRELSLGSSARVNHAAELHHLGFDDEEALALAIRHGSVAPHTDQAVADAMRSATATRLSVANPGHSRLGTGSGPLRR